MRTTALLAFLLLHSGLAESAVGELVTADLLVVGGDEAGCAAAVQAARLGVRHIVIVNDIEWLGGQFCSQGIGPIDEWTIVDGKRTEFPVSGAFQEIVEKIESANRRRYGVPHPGNGWCGMRTIEPQIAAEIFERWLQPYTDRIRVYPGYRPVRVLVDQGRVGGAVFEGTQGQELTVRATLTADSTDWGDIIRLSGAKYMAGPDRRDRFGEPSAPESLEPGGHQEMNPISWCPLLREADVPSVIERPLRYDDRSFADASKARVWVDWDGSGGIYNFAGWSIYTHRRLVDRVHFRFSPGTEVVVLNWPVHDYPLSTLPAHVVSALEQNEAGASTKNIVDMSHAQRSIIYADAKQRALEFLYWLQASARDQSGEAGQWFRNMKLGEDYGTVDRLPPKPYIREGLRLEALYVLREQDVRTEVDRPLWAKTMVPDGVFGYQFNMDFHPTRRKFIDDDPTQAWQGKFFGARNWNAHTDRAMFPIRGLVPIAVDGLLGCSKNIGVSSMVQSSLRLHGQMMHVGTAVGTVAAMCLRDRVQPREVAMSLRSIREVQRTLVRGSEGPGLLLWPWHDLRPEDRFFEAANMLAIVGIWRPDTDSLYFDPRRILTRGELACVLSRLYRVVSAEASWPDLPASSRFSDVTADNPQRPFIESMIAWGEFGPQLQTFSPDQPVTWSMLDRWLKALQLDSFASLTDARHTDYPLSRSECVEFVYRVLLRKGETFPESWLVPGQDSDEDGMLDQDDGLPQDRDNDSVADRLQPTR